MVIVAAIYEHDLPPLNIEESIAGSLEKIITGDLKGTDFNSSISDGRVWFIFKAGKDILSGEITIRPSYIDARINIPLSLFKYRSEMMDKINELSPKYLNH